MCIRDRLPFDVEATTQEEVDRVVATKISQELHAVQSYSRLLHGRGVMQSAPPKNVEESTQQRVREEVFPWPQIQEQATPERADGRFAKSFPLKFPMGVADPWQPRLRSDFSFIDAVQHLFRYRTGHFLNANDGHRVLWALFNTALREIAREKGNLVHKLSLIHISEPTRPY